MNNKFLVTVSYNVVSCHSIVSRCTWNSGSVNWDLPARTGHGYHQSSFAFMVVFCFHWHIKKISKHPACGHHWLPCFLCLCFNFPIVLRSTTIRNVKKIHVIKEEKCTKVSSSTMLIFRRTNCITTASGIVTLCKQYSTVCRLRADCSQPAYCRAVYRLSCNKHRNKQEIICDKYEYMYFTVPPCIFQFNNG